MPTFRFTWTQRSMTLPPLSTALPYVTEVEAWLKALPTPRSCGCVRVNSSPSSTSAMCVFCRHVSESRTQPVTLASSSTASCRCRFTLLRSVKTATTSCGNCDRLSVRSLSEDPSKTLVQAFISWTTATLCSSASLKDWWAGCSRFRTPPLGWLLVLGAATT